VPHTLHVTADPARFLMITVGAPAAGFLKEIGQLAADRAPLDRILEAARRHGVEPAIPASG
jgi:hypothetical protein